MSREDGGSSADKARELDRIQRQAQLEGRADGGLTEADLLKIEWSQRQEDLDRLNPPARAPVLELPQADPAPAEDILGETEYVDPTIGPTNEQQRAEAAGMATWLYRALRDPTTWIRLAGAGLGALGLFLLMQGLNAQVQQVPGGAAASATPTAAASGSPITQAPPPVNGTGTATASLTKVSGPPTIATRYNDRFSFVVANSALTLEQLSNKHVSLGTMKRVGADVYEFTTMAPGQGYHGRITGTTAEGQHTGTVPGGSYVYNFTMTFPSAFLATSGTAGANRPPEAGAIRSTPAGTSTLYSVQDVRDPDGDTLRYAWRGTNPCGTYSRETTPTFIWAHPHPPCPEESSHAGTITVEISDGRSAITRQYARGSSQGVGDVPPAGAPSPTAAIVFAAPAAVTVAAAPTAVTVEGGPNIPLSALGFVLLVGAIGLFFGGPRLARGPVFGRKYLGGLGLGDKKSGLRFAIPYPGGGVTQVKEEARPDPCIEEKRREAQARRRLDAARQRFEQLERLRADAERTRAEADRAARDAEAAKDDRPGAWWEDAETGRRTYTNADSRGRRAKAAESLAHTAAQSADHAKAAYEAAGGAAVQESAQEELRTAEAQWREADAALKACLGQPGGRR